MLTDKTQLLKEALDTFQKQGLAITTEWDAGGDQCICQVKIGEDENVLYKNLRVCDYLAELVMEQLQLPSVGEVYHQGNGVIELNEEESIVILFSAEFGYYDEDYYYDEKTGEYLAIETALTPIQRREYVEDPCHLRSLLHRADIHLVGRINRNKQAEASLEIQIRQGDEIIFTDEEQKPYLEWIEKILLESLIEMEKEEIPLKKGKKHALFQSVDVRAQLTEAKEVLFEINPSQKYFESYLNEKVLLVE